MFSISLKSKQSIEQPALVKKAPLFAGGDDETTDAAPTASTSGKVEVNKRLAAMSSGAASKAQRRRMELEQKVDQSVYQYDEIWDTMQAAKQMAKESKDTTSKDRQPKYIKNLLQTAETRRLDYLRAEEKKIQREREEEGDEFADREQFVTQAYKDQMAAVRKAEEEERTREELKAKSGAPTGMTHFYAQLLKQSEDQHQATVAATQSEQIKGPTLQNLTISKPPSYVRRSDKELAEEARLEGKDVELNDDNQIVDRRELLAAGLNLSAPNTRSLGGLQRGHKRKLGQPDDVQVHRAVGTAASRKEINERRAREVKQQLVEEEERARQREAEREDEERKRTTGKRTTEEQIQSARERYLERKRRKAGEGADVSGT